MEGTVEFCFLGGSVKRVENMKREEYDKTIMPWSHHATVDPALTISGTNGVVTTVLRQNLLYVDFIPNHSS